jgi:beta-glucanase (GH16 family)
MRALKLAGVLSLMLPLLGVLSNEATAAPPAAPAAVAAAPVVTTDECGALLKKADGSAWECTFVDDFDGATLDRDTWHVQTDTTGGSDIARSCLMDSPDNVAVSGGSLRLTVRKLAQPVPCQGKTAGYSAGQVSTFWNWSQQYGRFEVRMKNTASTKQGLHEAFWLWPDQRVPSAAFWPAAGEIDVVETYSYYPDLAIPFLHYTYADNWGAIPGLNTQWNCFAQRGVWNTYALNWTASKIEIFVNGKLCLTNTSGDPAFKKAYIMVLTQGLGTKGNDYLGTAPLPATTEVDYVKVWK